MCRHLYTHPDETRKSEITWDIATIINNTRPRTVIIQTCLTSLVCHILQT